MARLDALHRRGLFSTTRAMLLIRRHHAPNLLLCTGRFRNSTCCAQLTATQAAQLLSAADLQHYMAAHDIQATLVPHPAAVPADRALKSMVFVMKDAAGRYTSNISSSEEPDPQQPGNDINSAFTPAQPAVDDPKVAVLVLVPGNCKVYVRAVAAQLGLSRTQIRLATQDEAAAITGYKVGCIPPFGHRTPLRTLIDSTLTQHSTADSAHHQQADAMSAQGSQALYAGGGHVDQQLLMTPAQLLQAIRTPEVGHFTDSSVIGRSSSCSSQHGAEQLPVLSHYATSRGHKPQQDWISQLPLPWPAGAEEVHLVGVVAQRRKLAKLLLFCSLVPENVPPLPADGTAAYVRRLWQHPQDTTPCEVQVIMGKTIERQLGRDAAAALFDHIKVGSVLAVTGRVQQNLAVAKAANSQPNSVMNISNSSCINSNGTSSSASRKGQAGGPVSSCGVLDLVAHRIRVLHKNRDKLSKALRAAQREGFTDVTTAAELLQLRGHQHLMSPDVLVQEDGQKRQAQQQRQQQRRCKQDSSTAGPVVKSQLAMVAAASIARQQPRHGNILPAQVQGPAEQQRQQQQQQLPSDTTDDAVQQLQLQKNLAHPVTALPAPAADSSAVTATNDRQGSAEQECWQLPLQSSSVHWICDQKSVMHMRCMVMPWLCGSNSHNSSSSSSSSNSSTVSATAEVLQVVGLDCEWRPYSRSAPKTPVALLQVATHQHVFLIDLLAVCHQHGSSPSPQQQHPGLVDGNSSRQAAPGDIATSASGAAASTSSINCSSSNSRGNATASGSKDGTNVLSLAAEQLGDFLLQLLSSPNVVKVGFQLKSDLDRLQQSYPQLPCFQPEAVAAAEIPGTCSVTGAAPLVRHVDLLQLSTLAVPSLAKTFPVGLSKLAAVLLGKPLDKTQQTSDWEQRPLSNAQWQYAAVDAYVLVMLYDELLNRLPAIGGQQAVGASASMRQYMPITWQYE